MKTTARALLAFAFLASSSVLSAQMTGIAVTGETLVSDQGAETTIKAKGLGPLFTDSFDGMVLFTVQLTRTATLGGTHDYVAFQDGSGVIYNNWFAAGTTGTSPNLFDISATGAQTSFLSVLVNYSSTSSDTYQAWSSNTGFATLTPGVGIGNTGTLIANSSGDFSFGRFYAEAQPSTSLTFSDVQYTVIPEPSTYALAFGAATLAVVGYRRFRKGAN